MDHATPRKKATQAQSSSPMALDQGIPVELGDIRGFIFGGPYKKFVPGTRRLVGVKMAEEIKHPHHISIPTADFSTPSTPDMEQGLISAISALYDGNDIYAGCMGGIGRTGLFMGCMAKVMMDYYSQEHFEASIPDPVRFVRQNYMSHAIETEAQQAFVRSFDTQTILAHIYKLLTPPVERVEVEVVKEVKVIERHWPTWFELLLHKMGFDAQ